VAEQVDMTASGVWSRYRRARPPRPPRLGRWQQVLIDALDQNPAVGVRAAVADHLGRSPKRAELTAARRAAHSLATLGRARVLHVPGADVDANAGDRTYLVLARPNVIMNDIRLQRLAVAEVTLPVEEQPRSRPDGAEPSTLPPECGRWSAANPGRRVGQQIGCRRLSISCRRPRRAP
jgi:hypothetical protein